MNKITQEQVEQAVSTLFKGCSSEMDSGDHDERVIQLMRYAAKQHLTQTAALQEKLASALGRSVELIMERDALRSKLAETDAACAVMRGELGIIKSDAFTLRLEWFVEQGYDTAAMCISNIRKHSESALTPTAGKDLLAKLGRYEAALIRIRDYDHSETEGSIKGAIDIAQQTLKEL